MNPILLKPTNDTGSQVIVNGVPIGNMDAAVYYQYKRKLVKPIMEAYDSLAAENDILVLEGAGSPAEINLKQEDIVNMGMAKLAHAPVLLAGDIDRGGVFASLYGTMALLEESERTMVKGMIINKFRGDVELLKPGLRMLEERTHVPFVGVVPYLPIDIGRRGQPVGTAVRTARRGGAGPGGDPLAEGLEFYGFQPVGRASPV